MLQLIKKYMEIGDRVARIDEHEFVEAEIAAALLAAGNAATG